MVTGETGALVRVAAPAGSSATADVRSKTSHVTRARTPRTAVRAPKPLGQLTSGWTPSQARVPTAAEPSMPGATGLAAEHLVHRVEARAADPLEPAAAAAVREVVETTAEVAELLRATPAPAPAPSRSRSRRQAPANVERALAHAASSSPEARPTSTSEAHRQLVAASGAEPQRGNAPAPATPGRIFGDRGPQSVSKPSTRASRLLVETGNKPASETALRSTPGQRPSRKAETGEEARHRLASQIDPSMSPEEVDKVARDVIDQLGQWLEFDAQRVGEDEWD